MSGAVFLLSDFGTSDTYVGQMKAILFSEAPAGTLQIDLTHDVRPGAVLEGAFHLWVTRRHLAPGSVVLAVVDPGVGSGRMGIIARAGEVTYVGPDNGLFGLMPLDSAWRLPPPGPDSSNTFHGRDVFAPAAARVLCDPGWPASLVPLPPGSLVPSEIREWEPVEGGMEVSTAHVDRFGNIILWLPPGILRDTDRVCLIPDEGERIQLKSVVTYCEGDGFLLIKGSQGLMEIALNGAPAAEALGIDPGKRLILGIDG